MEQLSEMISSKSLKCLIQERLDGGSKKTISVVKKKPDADKRVSTHDVMLRSGMAVAREDWQYKDEEAGLQLGLARMLCCLQTFFLSERLIV